MPVRHATGESTKRVPQLGQKRKPTPRRMPQNAQKLATPMRGPGPRHAAPTGAGTTGDAADPRRPDIDGAGGCTGASQPFWTPVLRAPAAAGESTCAVEARFAKCSGNLRNTTGLLVSATSSNVSRCCSTFLSKPCTSAGTTSTSRWDDGCFNCFPWTWSAKSDANAGEQKLMNAMPRFERRRESMGMKRKSNFPENPSSPTSRINCRCVSFGGT
mmetsp:Transcript_124196/g.359167  ORF Transcript_124196/g.359167 Transcript_124196/m.359167 type:complete len:215 (-) Transcript_124196:573-1217(-)